MVPRALLLAVAILILPAAWAAGEAIDWEMVNRIRDEGLRRSRVMETMTHLTDVIGPRLTGSPGMKEANEWTRDRLTEWGLENARLEEIGTFGRGWSFKRAAVHMLEPRRTPLLALPLAWTPGTDGPLRGSALKVTLESEEDFEGLAGTLEGRILFVDESRPLDPGETAAFDRYSPDELSELTVFELPERDPEEWRKRALERREWRRKLNDFLVDEKALALVEISSRDGGTLRLRGGGSRELGGNPGVPGVAMAAEHYNWILRLLERGTAVTLEIDVTARFHDDDPTAYNTLAEIPGTDKREEIVMLGGHLDSWHAGAGSNDNAAGCAVAMEAVRILQVLGVRPRRTIRIALWTGEEQGLLGSQEYVDRHFATQPAPEDPEELKLSPFLRSKRWPLTLQPDHARLSAYFNLDNGSGKVRGIYTQGNAAVAPIFEAWLAPLRDLGADTVTNRYTGGTDHMAFDRVGLPGFQFIQDGLDYMTRTHHSNLDVLDHAKEEDLEQASVVLATFVYHAAMRDELLPRKPMPQAPPPEPEPEDDEDAEDTDPHPR